MPKTLLVIDDDHTNCRLIKAIFGAEGTEVLVAQSTAPGRFQSSLRRVYIPRVLADSVFAGPLT
jgi:CheY-like chemotaxis protein